VLVDTGTIKVHGPAFTVTNMNSLYNAKSSSNLDIQTQAISTEHLAENFVAACSCDILLAAGFSAALLRSLAALLQGSGMSEPDI
jgi:hypothetical protein